jgi:cytochrome c-type biogenesis protein CcsB
VGADSLAGLSNNLVYSAVATYTVAMVAFAADVGFGGRDDRPGRIGLSVTVLAFLLHAGAVLTRGLSAGRVPWGNMYEFSLTAGLAVTGVYLVLQRRFGVRFVGVVVVPAVLLTLGLAITVLYTESAELLPVLESVWLVVHVVAAVVSAGAFTVGAALTVLYLLRARADRRAETRTPALVGGSAPPGPARSGVPVPGSHPVSGVSGWLGRLPVAERLDDLAARVHAFTFPLWTFAVIAGAIWAENAWGRYWGWDPKETWAFITWVLYAAYLHARSTAGWRGARASVIALAGWAALMFNYFGVNFWIVGLHSYAGVG